MSLKINLVLFRSTRLSERTNEILVEDVIKKEYIITIPGSDETRADHNFMQRESFLVKIILIFLT